MSILWTGNRQASAHVKGLHDYLTLDTESEPSSGRSVGGDEISALSSFRGTKMDPLRQYATDEDSFDVSYSYGETHGTVTPVVERTAPRDYDDDLNPATIAQLQADANEYLDGETWTLIDGYGG